MRLANCKELAVSIVDSRSAFRRVWFLQVILNIVDIVNPAKLVKRIVRKHFKGETKWKLPLFPQGRAVMATG